MQAQYMMHHMPAHNFKKGNTTIILISQINKCMYGLYMSIHIGVNKIHISAHLLQ